MKTIGTLLGRLREFRAPAILTPLFIIGEVVLECLIPLIMVSLVDALDGVSLVPVMRLGIILVSLAFASLACGLLAASLLPMTLRRGRSTSRRGCCCRCPMALLA